MGDVEEAVWERVVEVISDPKLASRLMQAEAAPVASQADENALAETRARLGGLSDEEARLWRAWRKQSPRMTGEQLEAQLAEVTEERDAFAALMEEYEAALANAHADRWKVESVERWLGQARERPDSVTREEQGGLLHTVLDAVVIDGDGSTELRFAIPVDGDDGGDGGSSSDGDGDSGGFRREWSFAITAC